MQVHQGTSAMANHRLEVSSNVTIAMPRLYLELAARCGPFQTRYGTKRAEMADQNSARPYQRNRDRATHRCGDKNSSPHEPKPRPAMNMETTIETKAVVTQN